MGENEVLIETLACGVCSGDVFVYRNRETLAEEYSRLGHEGTGKIIDVGKQVTGFRTGDIVTTLSYPAYAEYFTAKPDQLVKLPAAVDPVYALGEAIACCVHAGNRFGTQFGDKVAIVGCGFMGLVCQQLAKIQGAGFILGIDPLRDRQEMSLQLGANQAISPLDFSAEDILAQFGTFDVVIEAAGVQSAVDLCTDLVTQHGKIILVGYHQSNEGLRTVNMQQWNFKAIDVINGHVRRLDEKLAAMAQGMDLLAQGVLETEPLVTVFPMSNIQQAFERLDEGQEGLFKAVITMDGS
jgi:threonine dehydrogenase-like Zn-dependent dehydrogenase